MLLEIFFAGGAMVFLSAEFGFVAYPVVLVAVFLSLYFFRIFFRTQKISKDEFARLHAKFKNLPKKIDFFAIFFVVAQTIIAHFFFSSLKAMLHAAPSEAVFTSNPQGLVFMAAFLYSIGTAGWLIKAGATFFLGKDYWVYYYNTKDAGFDTEKVYRFISAATMLLFIPALAFGLQDYTYLTEDGIMLNDWTALNSGFYQWGTIESIQKFPAEGGNSFYVINFFGGKKWNMSNEKWDAEKASVIGFISEKSGKAVLG